MSKSKEDQILELFYNEPTKNWHFKEIKEGVVIADNKLSDWLKRFKSEGLIRRIKEKGRMPYYISDYETPNYQNKKRLFALEQFYKSGFLNHLCTIEAETVILFGSFTRWDWHSKSDIDLFIYGDDSKLDLAGYQKRLKREIQLFNAKNEQEIKKIGGELMKNIIKGYLVKGDINFLEVKSNG